MRLPVLSLVAACALSLVPLAGAPAGPYDEWKALTSAERRLALRYFWQVSKVKGAAEWARRESETTFPALAGQDDPRDAFRHGLWNGSMTRRLESRDAAERWATAHESDPANPPVRRAMDLSNNQTGRDLVWAQARTSGPWWARRTTLPDDAAIRATIHDALRTGGLVVIEEVGGQRDPVAGRLVPSSVP